MSDLPSVDYMISDAVVSILSASCDTKEKIISECHNFDDSDMLQNVMVGFVIGKYGVNALHEVNNLEDDGKDTFELIAPYIDELYEQVTL